MPLVTASLTLFSFCVLTDSWELTIINSDILAVWLNHTEDLELVEIVKGRIVSMMKENRPLMESSWPRNSGLLTSTRSGLWRTCLDVSLQEYREYILPAFPWIGARCFSHYARQNVGAALPPWLRVMNISISCCLTSLIIVSAALILTVVGQWYRQATCFLVNSVLMLISVFFFLLSLSLHWFHRQERRLMLSGPQTSILTSRPAWSQYVGNNNLTFLLSSHFYCPGAAGVLTALLSSLSLYTASRRLITVMKTGIS